MPFIDFEDLDHTLNSTLTPNSDSRELGLSFSDSLSIEPAEADAPPPRFLPLRRDHHRRPMARHPRLTGPVLELFQLLNGSTCDSTALSHAAYAHGIVTHPQEPTEFMFDHTASRAISQKSSREPPTEGPKPAEPMTRAPCDTLPL